MKKWQEEAIDTSKVASYIRSDPMKFRPIMRGSREWCNRMKRNILHNLRNRTDTVGFDVIHDSKKGCRIVDRTIQVPCTAWHPSYWPALQELQSIVK